ncbi:hypothetical protein [Luteipulveratus halotolerans]|nr:hypothetical protein [Luteipulveratus halotolerans]
MTTPVAHNTHGEGWHLRLKRRHLPKVICFFAGLCFLLLGVFSYKEALQNRWFGVPIALLGVILMVLPFGGRPAPMSARQHQHGLLIPTRPPSLRRVIAYGIFAGLMLSLAAVSVAMVVVDGEYGAIFGGIVLLLIGLLASAACLGGIRSRRAPDQGLLLTPDEVVLLRQERMSVPWSDVTGFRDHWRRSVGRGVYNTADDQVDNWLTVVRRPGAAADAPPDVASLLSGTSDPSLDAATVGMDPYLALAIARFYLDHPEARAELGSHAAVSRSDAIARITSSQAG